MKPTIEHMVKNLLAIFQDKVKLIFSELKESDAANTGSKCPGLGNEEVADKFWKK